MGTRHCIVIAFLLLLSLLAGVVGVTGYGVYLWASRDLPTFTRLTDYRPNLVTTVHARDGQILGRLYREKRFLVSLDETPLHVRQAFLAMEDHTFYEHEGVDISAIIRAFFVNLREGDAVQGGSTINQQIIKRLLLTADKEYERKLKEAILAYRLKAHLSKDEILTIYLNEIYFGAGAYGVEAAAQTYFAKHVGDLSLAEAAVLAGLPKAPSTYNPFRHPHAAKRRQGAVLRLMHELQWITRAEYDAAMAEPLVYKQMPDPSWGVGAYYLEEVRRQLIEALSEENLAKRGVHMDKYGADALYESGLTVRTAVALDHQAAAEAAMRYGLEASSQRRGWRGPIGRIEPEEMVAFFKAEHERPLRDGDWVKALVMERAADGLVVRVGSREALLSKEDMRWARWRDAEPGDVVMVKLAADEESPNVTAGGAPLKMTLAQRPHIQGGLVSMEPESGDVVALVGGYDFRRSQFNRATQALRQPGSAFKPVVYSAAMDAGFSPASVLNDAPVSFGKWAPKNYKNKYSGPISLRMALAKSKNIVTARLAHAMGIRKVIARAHELGMEGEYPPYLPICLGAQVVTPLNLTQAYTAFATGGVVAAPRFILSVEKPWGGDVYRTRAERRQAISPKNAHTIATMLQGVVREGTARRARALNRPLAGKTGTTNEERDAWFIGFAPYLVTGVYVGFDDFSPQGKKETGSRVALPVWMKYREAVEESYPWEDFPEPEGDFTPLPELTVAQMDAGDDYLAFLPQLEKTVAPKATYAPQAKVTPAAATSEELLKNLF